MELAAGVQHAVVRKARAGVQQAVCWTAQAGAHAVAHGAGVLHVAAVWQQDVAA
jgi:hypothetical protein